MNAYILAAALCILASFPLRGLADPRLGEETLRNGSFEDPFPESLEKAAAGKVYSAFGWWYLQPDMIEKTTARTGRQCIRLWKSADRNSFNSYGQLATTTALPDMVYRLSFWYHTDATKTLIFRTGATWKTASGKSSLQAPSGMTVTNLTPAGQWACIEHVVTSPSFKECMSFKVYVQFTLDRIDPDKSLWIDDVSLRPLQFNLNKISWSDGRSAAYLDLPRARFGTDEIVTLKILLEAGADLDEVKGALEVDGGKGDGSAIPVGPFPAKSGQCARSTATFSTRGLKNGPHTLKVDLRDQKGLLKASVTCAMEIDAAMDAEVAATLKELQRVEEGLKGMRDGQKDAGFKARVQRQRATWLLDEARAHYERGAFAEARKSSVAALEIKSSSSSANDKQPSGGKP